MQRFRSELTTEQWFAQAFDSIPTVVVRELFPDGEGLELINCYEDCEDCDGEEHQFDEGEEFCETCDGKGVIYKDLLGWPAAWGNDVAGRV